MATARSGTRFYNPDTGRWLSRDPIASPCNPFLFVGNHPSLAWDYLGLVENGIITIGEIPECAKVLDEFLAKLKAKGIVVKGTVNKAASLTAEEIAGRTGLALAHGCVEIIAHVMYDIIGAKLEETAKRIVQCYIINADAVNYDWSKQRFQWLKMQDYAIHSDRFWSEGTKVEYYLRYFPCGGNNGCKYWGAVCWVPTEDFKDFRTHVIFDCGGDHSHTCRITVPIKD